MQTDAVKPKKTRTFCVNGNATGWHDSALVNLDNGVESTTSINEAGGFALAVDTDIGDQLALHIESGDEPILQEQFEAKFEGSDTNNTAEFRRAVTVQQHGFDMYDPINFAEHLTSSPSATNQPTCSL